MSRLSLSGESQSRGAPSTQLYLGLGFTTLATLILELTLTRLFSVVFFYHFAFLAISLALFGLGAGGVFSYVVAKRAVNLSAELGRLSFLNSVSLVLLLWFILSRHGEMSFWTLAGVYTASAVPFFFAGTVVSLAISEAVDRIGRAYCFDLTGAAAGCLLLIPFLDLFGGPNTVIAAAVLYGVAAAFWFNRAGDRSLRALSVLVALLLVMLMVVNGANRIFDVRWSKGERIPEERITKWNSFSRVAVSRKGTEASGYWNIVIDGDAAAAIPTFDWDNLGNQERRDLLYQGPGLAYLLRPRAKTLIIGAGGGYDIARALAGGSRDVTAVEINPIIANTIMRGQMVRESRSLYLRPEVRVAVEDGRSYVRRSAERYQVLQATLVDTWASTAAGAFALSENNLYTTDAFVDYLGHLAEDGLLSFTRWGFDPPRESLRLISLAMEALRRRGAMNAAMHVIAVREKAEDIGAFGSLDTVLISRRPFSAADIERARTVAAEAGMEVLYVPGVRAGNPFAGLLAAEDPRIVWRSYPYDISPVSDDRPFFFFTVQPRDVLEFVHGSNRKSADYKLNRAVPLLFSVMLVSLLATGLILVLPRWLLGTKLPAEGRTSVFLLYFFCLGAGYMLTQLALIQKFMILLGRPTYALTIIVFTMLLASGAGSYVSGRAIAGEDRRLRGVLAAVAVLIALLALTSGPAVNAAAGWPLMLRMTMAVVFVAPAAFFMGMPFPGGLRRLNERDAPSVRWAWSLNAAASVMGSVLSVALAIYLGLRATLLVAAGLYLAALLLVFVTRTPRRA